MSQDPSYRKARWSKHLDEILSEIAKYASICRVDMLQPGVIQRVIDDDSTVCGAYNEASFKKMRSLLMMHFDVRQRAADALGQAETQAIIDQIVARLRARTGN